MHEIGKGINWLLVNQDIDRSQGRLDLGGHPLDVARIRDVGPDQRALIAVRLKFVERGAGRFQTVVETGCDRRGKGCSPLQLLKFARLHKLGERTPRVERDPNEGRGESLGRIAAPFARQDRENVPPIGAAPLVGQLSRVAAYALEAFQLSERQCLHSIKLGADLDQSWARFCHCAAK